MIEVLNESGEVPSPVPEQELVDLGIAEGGFTAYGCDLTEGYIRINADYTT